MAARADLSFEDWLDFSFGRPPRSDYYPFFDERGDYWDPPPAVGIDYLTRLFDDPASLLRGYDDRQIGGALWLLSSEDSHCLYSRDVAVDARERCLAAICTLFSDLFEPRCTPVLGHLDQPGAGPINASCYMWWENLPFPAAPDDPDRERLDAAMVATMEQSLKLANPACQECGVHGLGHLVRHGPGVIDAILGTYSERDDILPELAAYARAARTGCIL